MARFNNKKMATKVCHYWRVGRCSRSSCKFLHSEQPRPTKEEYVWRNPNTYNAAAPSSKPSKKSVCKNFLTGKCKYLEDKCRHLHKWFVSADDAFSQVATLEGHKTAVTGISMPSGFNLLYSGSMDETVRVWDCDTGKCIRSINMGGKVGCMICEGPWIFVGVPNEVKVWNTQKQTEQILDIAPSTQVGAFSLSLSCDRLFAGTNDGRIISWKFNTVGNCFELDFSVVAHPCAVVSLVLGAKRLYSGSMDHSIKVWDTENSMQCLQTLNGHKSAVVSVLCWDEFLLSCSLEKTIKVWGTNDNGSIEVCYTHNEEHGVVCLAGVYDDQGKPVLMCSCTDNTIRLYDLPSFCERGKIFSKDEVRTIKAVPHGLFFTGDQAGDLKIWKWSSS